MSVSVNLEGQWDTEPYDYGVMESSQVCFSVDGHGWSFLSRMGGAINVWYFRWAVVSVGRVRIGDYRVVSGVWTDRFDRMTAIDADCRLDDARVLEFAVVDEFSPDGRSRRRLDLSSPVASATVFARVGNFFDFVLPADAEY
ncbi:hypothetical protein GCM10010124_34440 [Pilimelia terevasa]|uniref:Uncharacterized protein n=1 Tax=Pilimelia terevasa TaxID=53372 RepID=A0A8J3BQ14_9ACTN|nr:hypothetical protein GCM10010124_34440 [Pilimelia terevasa]